MLTFFSFSFILLMLSLPDFLAFVSLFSIFFVQTLYASNSSSGVFYGLISDETAIFMVVMLCLVLYTSYFYAGSEVVSAPSSFFSLLMIFVASYFVFTTSSFLVLFVAFESSVVPIVYIILKWGSYPERSVSAIMLVGYTSVFSIPFTGVLMYVYFLAGSFMFIPVECTSSVVLLAFLVFSVKLPIYGLHFWLPMAHVEAPTFGSMVLAGVLLKLGGVGLIRFSILKSFFCITDTLYSFLVVFLVYSAVLSALQSDFKRLVAYSSIVHMMVVPVLLLVATELSYKASTMVLFFHGVSSPMLFAFVGIFYSVFASRQLVVMRGVALLTPLMAVLLVSTFFLSLPAPPFFSFLAEVFFVVSALSSFSLMFPAIFLFLFFGLVFNLHWLASVVFVGSDAVCFSFVDVTYRSAWPLLFSFLFLAAAIFIQPLF